jgi:energy-coupling factor transporter ATP-binding protein EcfA2
MIGKIGSALWAAWLWFWDRLDPVGAIVAGDPDHRRGPRLLRLLRMSVARARREVLRLGPRWERAISVAGDSPGLRLWDVLGIPKSWEALHLLLLGTTGSGKTQILRALVSQILSGREGRVLIIDRKGDFTAWLAGRDDVAILAPWDRRTRSWAVGIDIADALGAAALAERFLPLDTQTNDRYWVDTPRNMIRTAIGILQALHAGRPGLDGCWGWADLAGALRQERSQLAAWLSQTEEGARAAQAILGHERVSAQDVYDSLSTWTRRLGHIAAGWPQRSGLSLRLWTRGLMGPRVLLVPTVMPDEELAAAVVRLIVETIASELLVLPDNPARRVWLVLDEFNLTRLDTLTRLLPMARSKGAVVLAALQDIARTRALYGRDLSSSILNSFAVRAVLRLGDPDTQEWAAKALGRHDVERHRQVRSEHRGRASRSETMAEQVVDRTEYLVMPDELGELPPLTGYLDVPRWPALYLRWPYEPMAATVPPWVPADWITTPPALRAQPNAGPVPSLASHQSSTRQALRPPGRRTEHGR